MKKILTAATAVLTLASAGAATAQSYGHYGARDARGDQRYEQRYDRRDDRRGDRRDWGRDQRHDPWARQAPRRYAAGRYVAPRGYQQRQWRRGERLPSHYRGAAYRVDHRRYALQAPPRGYEYNRVGNDVVLTAIATGVVASVIFGLFQ